MKIIPLTKGYVALISDRDFSTVSKARWYAHVTQWGVYAARRVHGRMTYMHKTIMGAHGKNRVDHRNGNGLDNRRRNLRPCTNAQNGANRGRQKNNLTSRFKGVTKHLAGKWMAQAQGKYLGLFETEEAAARAYNRAAKQCFGKFARVNFIC